MTCRCEQNYKLDVVRFPLAFMDVACYSLNHSPGASSGEIQATIEGEEMSPRSVRDYVRSLVQEFHPERVILFGSHARGQAAADSDVDLLVVMNCSGNTADRALEIRRRIPRSFPLDLIVRTPAEVRKRIREQDGFICSVMNEGDVLYEGKRNRMDG